MSETSQQAGARHEITLPGGVTMAFCLIPKGEFRMGQRGEYADEEPVHRVVIPEDFWMGETPVTQAQFEARRPKHENGFPGKPTHPAEQVTWEEAREFCQWLTAEYGGKFPKGDWAADLPDEARWEYACRAGTKTEFHGGDGIGSLEDECWFGENLDEGSTHPVGEKLPNRWGLYDIHGNVWEWCLDAWDPNVYRSRLDGWEAREWKTNEKTPPLRVIRSGSWGHASKFCRSAARDRDWPSLRYFYYGFRVCLTRPVPVMDTLIESET